MEKFKKYKMAPLSGGYMASSMIGFLISIIFVFKESPSWGLAFALVFATMFISAVASMTYADPDIFVELETKNKRKKTTFGEIVKGIFK
jgi:hypothetical protein